MYRLLLTMFSTLFIGAQVSNAQGTLPWLRTMWEQKQVVKQAQRLAMVEMNLSSAAALRKISFVHNGLVFYPPHLAGEVSPLTRVRMLLYAREVLLAVLVKEPAAYQVQALLRKNTKLGGSGIIRVEHNSDNIVEYPFNLNNLRYASTSLINSVQDMQDEESYVLAYDIDPIFLIRTGKQLQKNFGVKIESFLDRVEGREKRGRRDLARAVRWLRQADDSSLSNAITYKLAENSGFETKIEAFAEPLVDEWGQSALFGIETKAIIFDFAARLAAAHSDSNAVQANLHRIIALNNNIDRVELTVSLRGEEDVSLYPHNIDEVQQLYLQTFSEQE